MRARSLALAAVVACSATGVAVAQQEGDDTRAPQGSSVGDGESGPPRIAAAMRRATGGAGCRVRAFSSRGRAHASGPITYDQTPPTSGTHDEVWADFGVYEKPIPERFLVHDLEHGGVVVQYGARLSTAGAEAIGRFFTDEPGYLVIAPRASRRLRPAEPALGLQRFPLRGFVATSWQRRLVCTSSSDRAIGALKAFARRYRGAGPEEIDAVNPGGRRPDGLAAPTVAGS